MHILHQFLGVVLILHHKRQHILYQILAPQETINHVGILGRAAQQLQSPTLADHVLAHWESLRHYSLAVEQEGQLLEQPALGVLFSVGLPTARIEEQVFVLCARVLAYQTANVYCPAIWV